MKDILTVADNIAQYIEWCNIANNIHFAHLDNLAVNHFYNLPVELYTPLNMLCVLIDKLTLINPKIYDLEDGRLCNDDAYLKKLADPLYELSSGSRDTNDKPYEIIPYCNTSELLEELDNIKSYIMVSPYQVKPTSFALLSTLSAWSYCSTSSIDIAQAELTRLPYAIQAFIEAYDNAQVLRETIDNYPKRLVAIQRVVRFNAQRMTTCAYLLHQTKQLLASIEEVYEQNKNEMTHHDMKQSADVTGASGAAANVANDTNVANDNTTSSTVTNVTANAVANMSTSTSSKITNVAKYITTVVYDGNSRTRNMLRDIASKHQSIDSSHTSELFDMLNIAHKSKCMSDVAIGTLLYVAKRLCIAFRDCYKSFEECEKKYVELFGIDTRCECNWHYDDKPFHETQYTLMRAKDSRLKQALELSIA